MPEVVIGKDAITGELITIGDVERRSGVYNLGITGTGKSALMVNVMRQDEQHGHGIFFQDAHGTGIEAFLTRSDIDLRKPLLLDPEDETHTFGINPLSCKNLQSLTERSKTSTRAYNIFKKLWEDEWGPLLELFIPYILDAFIENQEFTLADVPRFLEPSEQAFRNYIVGNIKIKYEVADFWRKEFKRLERDQQVRIEAPLTRMRTALVTTSFTLVRSELDRV